MKIKALIFDFDNTLVDYYYGDKLAITQLLKLIPKEIDEDKFYERSGDLLGAAYQSNKDLGSAIHKYRLEATLAEYDIAWKESYLSVYLASYLYALKVNCNVVSILNVLAQQYPLGLLTNSVDAYEQRMRIKNSGLSHYFQSICISAEIGYYKPDALAFSYIAKQLVAESNECIFIGDAEDNDIKGSKNAGMLAIKKLSRYNKDLPTTADFVFSNFVELPSILSRIQ